MAKYRCSDCGYVYDEQREGTVWSDLPDDWICPVCGAAKSEFVLVGGEGPAGEAAKSAAASRAIFSPSVARVHRVFGYTYLALYLYFVWQMAPRLWTYQIEFPPRTVVHIVLGLAIGAALLLKIVIVRYFQRLDATLVPQLGTCLVIGSVVLIGVSAPFAFQLAMMERAAATEGMFTDENLERVRMLLAQTDLGESAGQQLATPSSLRAGREVLRGQCIECHDLRTVLARPRTPENWLQTVRRMADRTTMFQPLDEQQQQQVTAYLIAISPQIQRSTQRLREQQARSDQARQAIHSAATAPEHGEAVDMARAATYFAEKCSQCHALTLIDQMPPTSRDKAQSLVQRMVDEGLTGTEEELNHIVEFLTQQYVRSDP
jgi:rubredoxin/mono/diheme cytochrome c family protein